jgi:N-acetylglucosaminyldiphosphoundecaprenol N-acetyl-beta-D-mannosaminyltransferase
MSCSNETGRGLVALAGPATPPPLRFCGLNFTGLRRAALLDEPGFQRVVTANAQIIGLAQRSLNFRASLQGATLTFDGQIPYQLARLRFRGQAFDKISGSDLVYDLIERAVALARPIYVLGGTAAVNAAVLERLRAAGVPDAAGSADTYDAQARCARDPEVLEELARLRPAFVLVALGAPKQELWMARHEAFLREHGVRLAIGCGGAVDFLAGRFRRAPVWVQRIGLEGLYRLLQQPSWHRLHRLIDSSRILGLFVADCLRPRPAPAARPFAETAVLPRDRLAP